MENNKTTVIIGAGLTGLSCAYHLKKNYYIFEKESVPGGLCRSIQTNGFTFDITGHLLHLREASVKQLIQSLLTNNILNVKRNSWIFSKNTYTRYPFQAHTFGLPKKVIKECLSDFFAAQAKLKRFKKQPEYFYDWILRYFGKGIGRHFMFPYNEKLWQCPLAEMTTEWCQPFIPQPSVEEVLKGSLTDADSSLGYNTQFLYPQRGGIQSLINAFIPHVHNLSTQSEAVRLRWYDQRVEIAGKGPIMYDHLVSTIPLPILIQRMHKLPTDISDAVRMLRWTSVLCINLGFKRPQFTDRHWVYFPEKEFVFYRVGFHSNLSPYMAPKGSTSLYIEISHQPGQKPNLKKVLTQTIDGLCRSDILRQEDKILKIQLNHIPFGYVIYDAHRVSALNHIQAFLKKHGIYSIGRYGGWKYSYMEEAILDGKKTAQTILHE